MTRQELRRILGVAEKRTKVSVSFMTSCGFRPEVQGTIVGDDGLEPSYLPEPHRTNR
jgi:hypothetical protein